MDEEIVKRLEEEFAWKERELERLSREWYDLVERYDAPEAARLPVEERLKHWTDWALYLKQRIETHYRPRIAALEAEVERYDALVAETYGRRLPCREAEVAQQRYERAEADADKQFKLRAQAEADLKKTEQALFAANCMLRDLGVHPATLEKP